MTTRPARHNRAASLARRCLDSAPPRLSLALVDAIEARRGEPELGLLPALIRPGATAVDAGANRGVYARRLAHSCGRVIACEPQQRLAARLAMAAPSNLVVLPVALSDAPGEATLRTPIVGSMVVHTRSTLGATVDAADGVRVTTVLRLRLDDLALDHVGFMKIDVEGHELEVLAGAERTIERFRPRLLIECEVAAGTHPAQVGERLKWLDYAGWFAYGHDLLPIERFRPEIHQIERKPVGSPRPSARVSNFLFIPSDEVDDITTALSVLLR